MGKPIWISKWQGMKLFFMHHDKVKTCNYGGVKICNHGEVKRNHGEVKTCNHGEVKMWPQWSKNILTSLWLIWVKWLNSSSTHIGRFSRWLGHWWRSRYCLINEGNSDNVWWGKESGVRCNISPFYGSKRILS